MAVRSWQTNWPQLATCFDYPGEIRRIIYTTNSVESYHRQLRKAIKTKAAFPTPEAARKLPGYPAHHACVDSPHSRLGQDSQSVGCSV
jgi:transposase-like protein